MPKCKTGKARRTCPKENHVIICSECCASIRNSDCADRVYYISTREYEIRDNFLATLAKDYFIMEVNPELEDAVDTALKQLEKELTYQAMGSLKKLLEIYPKSYEVHYGIGTVHAVQGRHEKAIEWFDRALTIYP